MGTYNDGNLAFGSQAVTLTNPGGSPITFWADNIDYDEPTRVLTRPKVSGAPDAEVLIDDVGTGSMTLQVPATLAVPTAGSIVKRGATGTITDSDGAATIPIKVSKVGRKIAAGEEIKIQVEIRQRFN
jgi:hypothetical protein